MNKMPNTSTGLDRKKAFWFCMITCFLFVLMSMFLELTDNKVKIITGYYTLCGTVIGFILGTKANDTYQKYKMAINNKGDQE